MNQIQSLLIILLVLVGSFVAGQSGHANTSDIVFSEKKVKQSVEKMAMLYICSDKPLLDKAGITTARCQIVVTLFAGECWDILDKVVSDYEVTGDEKGTDRLEDITDAYIPCAQAKLFLSRIDRRAKTPQE